MTTPCFDGEGAAEKLTGYTVLDKWVLVERIRHDDGLSGASRSACYRAESKDGEVAFVKAFDFRREELGGDTDALESMVREYNYERNVHFFCNDQGVNRVTRIYGAGKIVLNDEVVHFLVCEWANKCLRENQPPGDCCISPSERLLALRDVAAALSQLHRSEVAHQDIKPSNAMCSDTGIVKLTDLGSSSCKKINAPPHDQNYLVGQPNYAPYELLYECPPPSWDSRRIGCDLFLLGNLCFTSFVGCSLSHCAMHSIPKDYRHSDFHGSYEEVIPHLIEAHEVIIRPFLEATVPTRLVDELVTVVSTLCHPDPALRGHPKNHHYRNNPLGLERFITTFDILIKRAKLIERGIK